MKLYHDHALHQCAKWIKSGRKIMKSISITKMRNSESLNVMRSRKKSEGIYTSIRDVQLGWWLLILEHRMKNL